VSTSCFGAWLRSRRSHAIFHNPQHGHTHNFTRERTVWFCWSLRCSSAWAGYTHVWSCDNYTFPLTVEITFIDWSDW